MTARHPHAIDAAEVREPLWEFFARQNCHVCLGCSLVVTEFQQPNVTPVLRAFRFPEDGPAVETALVMHVLQNVPAMSPDGDGLDTVVREGVAENILQL